MPINSGISKGLMVSIKHFYRCRFCRFRNSLTGTRGKSHKHFALYHRLSFEFSSWILHQDCSWSKSLAIIWSLIIRLARCCIPWKYLPVGGHSRLPFSIPSWQAPKAGVVSARPAFAFSSV